MVMTDQTAKDIFHAIRSEMDRASKVWPNWPNDPMHAMGVLTEELGEMQREANMLCYEPHKASKAALMNEAIQLGAMVFRFIASIESYQFEPGESHRQD
jgi:hypothetical protein